MSRSAPTSGTPSEVVERYHLLRRIAEDGDVVTWEGFDNRLERPVAIRVLADGARDDGDGLERLRRSASSMPGAEHVLDGGSDPVFGPFLVTQLPRQLEQTQPLPTVVPNTQDAPRPVVVPVQEPRVVVRPAQRESQSRVGLLLLGGVLVLVVAALAFAASPGGRGAATDSPTVTPQAASPTTQAAAPSPQQTITNHYAAINDRRFSDGYQLMSAHLRSLNSPADYASWFVDKISIHPLSIQVVSQTADAAVVHSVVETTDRVNGRNTTTQVAEEFDLIRENGAWRIDRVQRL